MFWKRMFFWKRMETWVITSGILLLLLKGLSATVLDLSNMLVVMTKQNPLDFLNYGNWCGLGGSGYPVDSIDRCCKMHDLCYEKATDTVCLDEKPHLAFYEWKYSSGKIHCSKRDHACGLVSCRCDGKFTACIDAYKDTYNPRNKKIRPPLYNALNRVLTNFNKGRIQTPYISINKKVEAKVRRADAPFISIKLL